MNIYVKLTLVIVAGSVILACLAMLVAYDQCMRSCTRLGVSREKAAALCEHYSLLKPWHLLQP